MTDTDFAARRVAARKSQSLAQQQLADRSGAPVTQLRRYEAGISQPILHVLRSLALALSISAHSLLFDEVGRGLRSQTFQLMLEADYRHTPDEQDGVTAFIKGTLLCHPARQAFSRLVS